MDWNRYSQLLKVRDSGHVQEAIVELKRLAEDTEDNLGKALVFMEIAYGLRLLGRVLDARRNIQEACELLGPQHEYYPRAAFQSALLDMDERDWKRALKKLDEILEKYAAVVHMEEHKDLLAEVQRNRGISLAELRRFHEARAVLELYRSEPYERERNLYYLGACEYELGDFTASQRDFEEMLSLDGPTPLYRAYAHEYLGRLFYNNGQIARAKMEFEECLVCPDRDKSRDPTLLKWLISSSKELNQAEDFERYSDMLRKLH